MDWFNTTHEGRLEMERKRRIVLTMVLLTLTLILAVTPVFAYQSPFKNCFLPEDKWSVQTGTVYGTYKLFDGVNYSMSLQRARFQAHYSTGSGWNADEYRIRYPNVQLGDTSTTKFSTERLWYLQVRNETIIAKGGVARGNIWYDN